MANPESILNGQAETLDLVVDADGTAYLKAAGDSLGVPTGASDPMAPQLVQLTGTDYLVGPPTGLALVEGTGTLAAATYFYRVSALTSAGETVPCAEVGLAITATHGVVLTWNAVRGATGYRIYGRATGAELFIAEVSGTTLTYTDDGSITPAGAMPTANTARIVTVTESAKPATGTVSSVAGSASSVTLLAANAARKGATVTNDSSALLYVKLAASAASTSSYTVVLAGAAAAPFSYMEVPFSYTGEIRGIWASATGNARVTELT
jgi:hypothetical protein